MSSSMRSFGLLEDGRSVEAITLGEPDGVQVEVLTYGAIIRRVIVPLRGSRRDVPLRGSSRDIPLRAARRDVVLHFDRLEHYERDRAYVGPVVGRFGNRIAQGRFTLDGVTHQVATNEGGNHLHGGALGFSKRLWRVLETGHGPRVVLGLHSPAGEEGYPGTLDATIELVATHDSLQIRLGARTDAPTPVNLTYHPYFNLSGDPRTPGTAHWLRIPASHYLPVGAGLIPTGDIEPVANTTFDFRRSRKAEPPAPNSHPQLSLAGGYDHCWVLDDDADCACELMSPTRDLVMTIRGTGPGVQFYNGQFLSRAHPRLGGGVILEPQGFPDAPNQPRFPNAILRPGESHRAEIEYVFSS